MFSTDFSLRSPFFINIKQHANNNVQRLLLANKCDAEDERRVWKDQGARVSIIDHILSV